jgi:hypothetical protein
MPRSTARALSNQIFMSSLMQGEDSPQAKEKVLYQSLPVRPYSLTIRRGWMPWALSGASRRRRMAWRPAGRST